MKKIWNENGDIVATIISIEQMNSFYDPQFAGNGGGYDQPKITIAYEGHMIVLINSSCGDFGTSYYAGFFDRPTDPTATRYACWGTMDDDFHTDFEAKDQRMLDDICALTGWYIPTKENARDWI